jgi:hypothetical protein
MANEGWGAPEVAPIPNDSGETEAQFIARRDAIINDWLANKQRLDSAKQAESETRLGVTSACFPNPKKGTQRYELNGGYKLKLVYGFNYKLGDKDMVDPATNEKISIAKQVEDLQDAISELGNEGPLLSERLIKWEPKLVEAEYLKLNSELPIEAKIKEMVDSLLTITPASPQLSFEEPKTK